MKSLTRLVILLLAVCVCFVFVGVNLLYLKPKLYNGFGSQTSAMNLVYVKHKPSTQFETRGDIISRSTETKIEADASVPHLYRGSLRNPWSSRFHEIVLAVVACGDRLAETLVVIKSAILFTKSPLKFIVVADDHLIPSFREKLNEWQNLVNNSFSYELHHITFPLKGDTSEWRRLFKPCAAQRLFLPTVLSHIDALLYVDTDTLFLGPLEDVWRHFELMNSSQIAALTPEHEDPNTGWYNRFARHPYYGKLGVNSGVMLMNLTRMRTFRWTDYVVPIYKEYKLKITWGDQDIINIIFHFHPDKLYVYPCRYNYRPDHCMYMSVCHSADKEGVAVLHGSRGSFHSEKQPPFHALYTAMEEYQLGTDPHTNLYLPIKNYLELASSSNCDLGLVVHSQELDSEMVEICLQILSWIKERTRLVRIQRTGVRGGKSRQMWSMIGVVSGCDDADAI
ncbi:glucoside xylosyltransferase 1 isoform X1 [Schistocerca americana]|uniref:glucoside xylosyltransferase 1 isoform X1 n=1 Tax=Schistocerca americana TaxID=7009 RepID=UPI001F4FACEA|nr:glucoside xylosyltransferase 1 isoform X1 [Schistocerca americana]